MTGHDTVKSGEKQESLGGRGQVSGFPWHSGGTVSDRSSADKQLRDLRGKDMDTVTVYGPHGVGAKTEADGWLDIRGGTVGGGNITLDGFFNGFEHAGGWLLDAGSMIPCVTFDQVPYTYSGGEAFCKTGAARRDLFAAIAAGIFQTQLADTSTSDAVYEAFAQKLKRIVEHYGWPAVVVRMNHEANSSLSYPHYVEELDQATPFIQMTRRCVDIIRANATSSKYVLWVEQNFGRQSSGGSVGPDLYIGDAHTDGLSLDFYDRYPPEPITNEASMQKYLTNTSGTSTIYKEADGVTPLPGCRGPQTWFEFAKSRGKLISVGEWGLALASERPGGENDNPAFIEGVFGFFTKYAANIAYENYFTQSDSRFTNFPESAAKYGQLWGSLA